MEELANLLDAENQLVAVLPKLAQASESSGLKVALEGHLEVTKEHVRRLERIFSDIGKRPKDVVCESMKGFVGESENVINKAEMCPARDAAIISVAQRVEQYEVFRYQTACQHGTDLGSTKIVEVLIKTLNEERTMNFQLNELAQYMINVQAINPFIYHQPTISKQDSPSKPKSGGFYIPENKFKRGGIKKKSKSTDVSRFISEGNPNIQDPS